MGEWTGPPRPAIETLADLLAWAERAPERHCQISPEECSCGWSGGAEWWAHHVKGGPVHDLGAWLPSGTSDLDLATGTSSPISCANLATQQWETIDWLHKRIDALVSLVQGCEHCAPGLEAWRDEWVNDPGPHPGAG